MLYCGALRAFLRPYFFDSFSRAGLLLPCNVLLFERDDRIAVLGIIDPVQQLNAPDGPLAEIAKEIGERLARVAQKLDA